MNNKIKKDADDLLEYYENYTVKHHFENGAFKDYFLKSHNKLYAYLVLVSEIKYQNPKVNEFPELPFKYLEESVSDILESFFSWTNGAYKAANLLLRSSIENFLKFAIGCIDDSVFNEKNVYKIFEKADSMKRFCHVITRETISNSFHRVYGELCKYTHTATCNDMENLTSLNNLPKWDKSRAKDYYDNLSTVINSFLAYFLANNKNYIDGMYRVNKDIYYDIIPKGIVKQIEKARNSNNR